MSKQRAIAMLSSEKLLIVAAGLIAAMIELENRLVSREGFAFELIVTTLVAIAFWVIRHWTAARLGR